MSGLQNRSVILNIVIHAQVVIQLGFGYLVWKSQPSLKWSEGLDYVCMRLLRVSCQRSVRLERPVPERLNLEPR
jgi:hypothetical protein